MNEKIQKLLSIAAGEVGVQEDPLGSNRGARVEEYQAVTGTAPGSAWCGCFAAWCFVGAGYSPERIWLLAAAKNWFIHQERKVSPDQVRPGDVFGIHNTALGRIAHVGIVESVRGQVVTTIEGNTNTDGSREGYAVCRRKRSISKIAAFARWT